MLLNVPISQSEQSSSCEPRVTLRFVPAGHFSGVLAFAGQKCPTGQSWQPSFVAVLFENVPAGHFEQPACPAVE
jgi:hypothetical protein